MSARYVVTTRARAQPPRVKPKGAVTLLGVEIPNWFIALLIGTFVLGAIVWTPIGRKLAVAPIAKAARVSEKKVEEWLAAG